MKHLADKVYVISLPTRADRRERICSLFRKEEIQFEFKDGVTVNREEIIDAELAAIRGARYKSNHSPDKFAEAVVGCKRAHIRVLTEAKRLGLGSAMILEDDVAFKDGWYERFQLAVAQLPDNWLQLYLSAGCYRDSKSVSSALSKLTGAWYTTAILYSRHGIAAALASALSAQCEIDEWFGDHLHPFGCSFVVEPHVVYQLPGHSDIIGGYTVESP